MTELQERPNVTISALIRDRRSIRDFRDERVEPALIKDLLRDALWAPSPHNSQPWRFTVLFESKDKGELAAAMAEQLASELASDGLTDEQIRRQTERSVRRIGAAPVVLLCSLVSHGLVEYPDGWRNQLEWQMAVQSVGAVLQTLFLLAAERGLGSCWMAAPMYCPDVVRAALDLPHDYEPQALALFGYARSAGRIRDRRPFSEAVDFR